MAEVADRATLSDEKVQRLRDDSKRFTWTASSEVVAACDEILRLRTENAALRSALQEILDLAHPKGVPKGGCSGCIAQRALNQQQEGG